MTTNRLKLLNQMKITVRNIKINHDLLSTAAAAQSASANVTKP
jgi:hypothetical protein